MPFYLIPARLRSVPFAEIEAYEMLGSPAYVQTSCYTLHNDREYWSTRSPWNGYNAEPMILHPDTSLITPREMGNFREALLYRHERSERAGTLPEDWPVYPAHMAYASVKFPGQVAYTPDDRHALEDRQVTMLPGRYLRRFWPALPDDAIAELTSKFGMLPELHITRDADECERVYRRAKVNRKRPHWKSCMGPEGCDGALLDGKFPRFPWYDHPARVYAGPDLAIGYLGEIDNARARVVLWPDKHVYTRIYSDTAVDESQMKRVLDALGYRHVEDGVSGARVRKMNHSRGGYVMPYIDGAKYAAVDGEYIVLGDGRLDVQNTSGSTLASFDDDEDMYTCARCGAGMDEDGLYCESCNDERWICAACDNEHFDWDGTHRFTSDSGSSYCRSCWREHSGECPVCDEECSEFNYSRLEQRNRSVNGLSDAHIHTACYDSHTTCVTCDDWIPNDDVMRGEDDDAPYCTDCHAEHVEHARAASAAHETASTSLSLSLSLSPESES